jgi:hypothetical protein
VVFVDVDLRIADGGNVNFWGGIGDWTKMLGQLVQIEFIRGGGFVIPRNEVSKDA